MNNLIIVESPAKVKTIKKFVGKNYTVDATMGHLIDIPRSSMGIDIDNDFEPKYITIRGKGDLLSKLKKEALKADRIYLATDPDREGEAISFHLRNVLLKDDRNKKKLMRITFNEITKKAVQTALRNPREIDMNLVDAQQARRVIDRLVGYSISPLLWKKLKKGLSAGRVQSSALKMICEREKKIQEFSPEEYWTLNTVLKKGSEELRPIFYGKDTRIEIKTADECDRILEGINKKFLVEDIKKGERQKKRPLPFTTSTMQQEASKTLSFAAIKTMRVAQTLYEDGYITYLRTDSTRISDEAKESARVFIEKNFGLDYNALTEKKENKESHIQDAHEAIRPSDLEFTPDMAKDRLQRDEARLYRLIYNRFLASRMKDALYDTETVRLSSGEYIFTVSGSRLSFDGFLKVYKSEEDKNDRDNSLPSLIKGEELDLKEITKEQHFTSPPPHFTEASLVKGLEDEGIGRPSTYAPTIGTLLQRRYITKEKKNLFVTETGMAVNDMMSKNFPSIVDTSFTANMETLLDSVAEGKMNWKTIIENFYPDLKEAVDQAQAQVEKIVIRDEETDAVCEECGRKMVIKYGPHGKFLACPGFPECRNTRPYIEYAGFLCPDCGSEILKRRSQKGRIFYSCSTYPECGYTVWNKPKELREGLKKEGEIFIEKIRSDKDSHIPLDEN